MIHLLMNHTPEDYTLLHGSRVTVTANEHSVRAPQSLVARQPTQLTPTGKQVPGGGEHSTNTPLVTVGRSYATHRRFVSHGRMKTRLVGHSMMAFGSVDSTARVNTQVATNAPLVKTSHVAVRTPCPSTAPAGGLHLTEIEGVGTSGQWLDTLIPWSSTIHPPQTILVRDCGQVMSRQPLVRTVWPPPVAVLTQPKTARAKGRVIPSF